MTHGEELGSEMHQDSVVLTYLEGLLMHQAAGGSGTAVDKKSTGHSGEDQNFKISGNIFPNCQSNGPVLNTNTYQGSGMLHLKKARLLQSSEDWNAAKRRRLSDSIVDLNGKKEALLAGMVENVPKGKQDSTLLASLLQSFSSRLQSVALSQQIRQSLKEQGYSLSHDSLQVEKDLRCYGVASSHLKTLLKKSKAKDQKLDNSLPDITKNLPNERFIESPHAVQSGPKVINEPLSCAARLQAVASMVEKRSSPAASPKPSVACSQLALLLSSEAHLQQYSREHALKAQNANQIASERLAAMARLQESSQKDSGQFSLAKGMTSHLNGQTGSSTKMVSSKSNMAPFQNSVGITHSTPKNVGFKSTLERSNVKTSPNSSLLLHLLKSQNTTKQLKGHEESSTPTTIDEYSDNNPSFTDDSSDDESSHSNCLPIDLSFKQRTDKPDAGPPASLDNLTQSLLHSWDPKVSCPENKEDKDTPKASKLNPHQKVTLLQLLLGHKSEEKVDKSNEPQGPHSAADVAKFTVQTGKRTPVTDSPSANRMTPLSTPPLLASTKADSPINLSHQSLAIKRNSPPYACSIQPDRLVNPASKHLIDLSKSKEIQGAKLSRNDSPQNSSAFSASKLLQNLAQCGMQTSMSSEEQRPSKHLLAGNTDKPVGLIDRLNSPLLTNKLSMHEENNKIFSCQSVPTEQGLPGSEIENLLERRTVLQLLLGTPNKGKSEKKERVLLRDEGSQEQTDKALNEQILTVKIKTEPSEESNVPYNSNAQQIRECKGNKFQGFIHSLQRNTAASPASEEMKSEPLSPQDFSFSKNGLLSRLLRQNQDSYPADELDRTHRNNELTHLESKSLCTVPKKRKLHAEPLESPLKKMKTNVSDAANNHVSPTEALYGPLLNQQELKFSRSDSEFKYAVSHGSNNESENRSWSRDSKGFNVLKQLLLSENCERDLSQHRNSLLTEGKKRGNKSNATINKPEFSISSVNTLMGSPVQQSNCVDHRTFHYPVVVKSPASSPFPEHLGSTVSRLESDQFSVCPVPGEKGPIRWVITGMDKNDYEKDSPRLTKTNPILYYMLQKGGNSVSSQEAHDKEIWNEPSFTDSSTHVTIKEELTSDAELETPFNNLRSPYNSHMGNKTSHQHGVNGEVHGLLEKVLTIKKEPE
ncbi:nuclear receptor-interacting protein 1 [Oxyura jamaicensis]|uniref:nuclear receptor-interacting protein 1 n=1 Tax=Oxyura jamaicensis TaxID=8884 RepID=UPI0015A5C6BA|nr:nuclear receptor-interacting protein 1 [Oxyura jamaicensis]XP_035171294.1 nuclear receptor-interacting protein 1 [Oxyura jamaicensis]XP_035171295.1 nuclear receptor-interacting protein 1 [Oxyura jamaicensis]XP_035171296.1 nuclear receptor-interacting protein 1 [Oxyura jamaicensis]XP_035171297.1 nuclear receptor-interacting protein 1 [Oxyura jamaicensis]XP_035171298.1 nuclear receptor-interacting protein 1 [Oxyura jamaicensis]XP_035171299.1 nuclear receptor-interacting protein 1 [Oxyura jam